MFNAMAAIKNSTFSIVSFSTIVLLASTAIGQQYSPTSQCADCVSVPSQSAPHATPAYGYQGDTMIAGYQDSHGTYADGQDSSSRNPWGRSASRGRTTGTLPGGRRYLYGNRYFGTINNRFYGPQYGNF